jgi:hypothetical protein
MIKYLRYALIAKFICTSCRNDNLLEYAMYEWRRVRFGGRKSIPGTHWMAL